jgi:uncharacterized protein YkwD
MFNKLNKQTAKPPAEEDTAETNVYKYRDGDRNRNNDRDRYRDRDRQTLTAKQTPETAPAPTPVLAPARVTTPTPAPAPAPPKDRSIGRADNETADWDIKSLDAARGVDYLTDLEKDFILELNMVRRNPKRYAELYIQPELRNYTGSKYSAAQECVAELSGAAGVGILRPEKGMYLAAKDHAADQAKTGETGHEGSDGSAPWDRLRRYGSYKGGAAENCTYGAMNARERVVGLLIDDGTPSRGHRKNIMNGAYTRVGLAVGTHTKYGGACVMDFAGDYVNK